MDLGKWVENELNESESNKYTEIAYLLPDESGVDGYIEYDYGIDKSKLQSLYVLLLEAQIGNFVNERDNFIKLIKGGVDVNEVIDPGKTGFPFTLLHFVALTFDNDGIEWLELILDSGADIEARLINGDTPLSSALKGCQSENFLFLLKSGANPDPCLVVANNYNVDKYGPAFSPLMIAANYGDYEAVTELIRLGVDINKVDSLGVSALKHANGTKCINALLDASANL
jgi:hypothetical protein